MKYKRHPKMNSTHYRKVIGITKDNWKNNLIKILRRMYVDENGCWIWTGCITPDTHYGIITIGNKHYRIHRFIAFCFHDLDINNSNLVVMHTCDIRNCINPFHLKVGTQSENLIDSFNKGRYGHKNYRKFEATQ